MREVAEQRVFVPRAWVPTAVALGWAVAWTAKVCPVPRYGDPAELATAAVVVGLPHPTGYPLWVALAALWVRALWWLPAAVAANLLSGACWLIALLLVARTARRLGLGPWPAAAAVAVLGAAGPVWGSATVAEVYGLHGALGAAVLWLMATASTDDRPGAAVAASGVAGLAAANHMTSILLAPIVFVWMAGTWRRLAWPRSVPLAAAAAWLAGIAIALGGVLWLDARHTLNYIDQFLAEFRGLELEGPLERAAWLLLARQYGAIGGIWTTVAEGQLGVGIATVAKAMSASAPVLAAGGTAGLIAGVAKARGARRDVVVASLAVALLQLAYFATYAHSFVPSFYAQGWVALAVGFALLIHALVDREDWRGAVAAAVVAVSAVSGLRQAATLDWSDAHSRDTSARQLLWRVEPDAVVFSTWADSTLLWYAQYVDRLGTNVQVVNALPQHWMPLALDYRTRPMYFAAPPPDVPDDLLAPVGRYWTWKR